MKTIFFREVYKNKHFFFGSIEYISFNPIPAGVFENQDTLGGGLIAKSSYVVK